MSWEKDDDYLAQLEYDLRVEAGLEESKEGQK